ncbi:helix-turn-helix domain-containing protein [Chitinophaga sp. HK235]|uniref:helix-turn-helix domain-containing protein n=1 Tax=Chitinophaga sp. HK235 TaxID=2952571 RepID=UPI001BA655BA|nr:helix-turn-helix domain-containing protein [Chitinophaga sp. HK235]
MIIGESLLNSVSEGIEKGGDKGINNLRQLEEHINAPKLGKMTGYSRGTISKKIEHPHLLKVEEIQKLAEVLRVTPERILKLAINEIAAIEADLKNKKG